MKIILFAGGAGTRLWPLSRKNSPKQFEKMFDGKSTIQMMFNRIRKKYDPSDIYISTNRKYSSIIQKQLSELPVENIIVEPEKRDLAPALGYSFMRLKASGYTGPVAIIWSDGLIEDDTDFVNALQVAEELIIEKEDRFIYFGEKPRFANENLGWITIGNEIENRKGVSVCSFKNWIYRPPLEECKKLFAEGKSLFNLGYFVTSIDFVLELYQKNMPKMYSKLEEIIRNPDKLDSIYPTLESISFDDAILVKTTPDQAVVLGLDIGWSDPGTHYALKEALQKSKKDNVTKGEVIVHETEDSLVYNTEKDKVVATIGLNEFIIVNTEDALLVCHKDQIPKIKDLLQKFEGTKLEKYL